MHVYKRPGEQAVADPMAPPAFMIERDPANPDKAFIPVPYIGEGAGPGGAGAKGGGEEGVNPLMEEAAEAAEAVEGEVSEAVEGKAQGEAEEEAPPA